MDLDDSNEENIDFVDIANAILATLNIPEQISEEDLYSDEFYIIVFTALTSEEGEMQIEPGKTPEEKVENLKLISEYLSKVFPEEIEIDAKKLILKKDKENAYKLVMVFYSLIHSKLHL